MLFPPPTLPSAPPRIVVTGAGIITALGGGWNENAKGFRNGLSGARPVTLFDVEHQRVKVAAEVRLPDEFEINRLSKHQLSRVNRAGRLLLSAAAEAWHQAGWNGDARLPLVLGTTAGGMASGEDFYKQALKNSGRRNQPTRALMYHAHAQARVLMDALGFSGPVMNIANACATGSSAIGIAWEMLRRGQADHVLTGGYDALCQLVFSGFDSLQTLSKTACRPFDAHRDGLLLGEGASVLALETLDHAKSHGANILGEIIGYGASFDSHHLTQPQPEGNAARLSMCLACESAGISACDVDYVNAHGTGTPLNDAAEAVALNRWAGDYASKLNVSSTKSSVGHLLGGSGAVEATVCLMALKEQWLPPQNGLNEIDPVCQFRIIQKRTDAAVKIALSNSFGFGGVNATLIFRRWE